VVQTPRERGSQAQTDALQRRLGICFLIDRLNCAGTETQLLALIRNLDRSRFAPHLCLLDGLDESSRSLEPPDCPVLRLGVKSLRRANALAPAWKLLSYLKGQRIQILQTYFPDSTIFGVLLGRLARVPHLLQTRNGMETWPTRLHRRLGSWCNRLVTCTLANCDACRQAAIVQEGLSADSIVVLENGVDLERFAGIRVHAAPERSPCRVGAVANLRAVKRVDLLVRAAAELHRLCRDVSFAVAGEGPLRMNLQSMIQELGMADCFHLRGQVADIPSFLESLDVAVLCSEAEGMSNALLEYMAAGRAIVASKVDGNAHLIRDGMNGLLVPPAMRWRWPPASIVS
jgi:glycosyltransferase involved in cell wall biosynthesis